MHYISWEGAQNKYKWVGTLIPLELCKSNENEEKIPLDFDIPTYRIETKKYTVLTGHLIFLDWLCSTNKKNQANN